MNIKLKTVVVAPCTTSIGRYPWRIPVNSTKKPCEVALDQIRTFDQSTDRFKSKMCDLTDEELQNCLDKLHDIFTFDRK